MSIKLDDDTALDRPIEEDESQSLSSSDASDAKRDNSKREDDASGSQRTRDRVAGSVRGASKYQISVKALALGVLVVGLIAAVITTSWLLIDKNSEVDGLNARAAKQAHAESVSMNYAVGAAEMDFAKSAEWKARLIKWTSAELSNRLTQAATSMEQITAPLQWTSKSTPIAATVRSQDGGKYVVDCFVSVLTKNSQAPEGVQSTATYSVTVDSTKNWLITDVGGIGAMLGTK